MGAVAYAAAPFPTRRIMQLWKPGISYYKEALPVRAAIQSYDERLEFGFHPATGQWVAALNMENRHPDGPMIVMGWNEIPNPRDAVQRLQAADTRRHGDDMLKRLNDHNEQVRKEQATEANEAIAETAEAFEWAYRREGKHPNPRIFVPREV
jgi:hypothetical protein